jgi:arylformamidase
MTDQTNWIDVTIPIHSGLVHWPGDPEPTFERIAEIQNGAAANVTYCRMTAHTGTHMDAPVHFLDKAAGMETFPASVGIGRARVIAMPQNCAVIAEAHIEGLGIEKGDRVLFKTRNSNHRWDNHDFQTDYVGLDASASRFLANAGVQLVGIDYLSVGTFSGDGPETHQVLLSAGVWIVEGLNLVGVEPGLYDLICLPLPIEGSDGSPARVLLRPVGMS